MTFHALGRIAAIATTLAGCAAAGPSGAPEVVVFGGTPFVNVDATSRGSLNMIRYAYESTAPADPQAPREVLAFAVVDDVHDAAGLSRLAAEFGESCREPDCRLVWRSSPVASADATELDVVMRSSEGNYAFQRLVLRDGVAEMVGYGRKAGGQSAAQADAWYARHGEATRDAFLAWSAFPTPLALRKLLGPRG